MYILLILTILFGWLNKNLKSARWVFIICKIELILVANIYSCSSDGFEISSNCGVKGFPFFPLFELPFDALFSCDSLYWWYWYSICSISLFYTIKN